MVTTKTISNFAFKWYNHLLKAERVSLDAVQPGFKVIKRFFKLGSAEHGGNCS